MTLMHRIGRRHPAGITAFAVVLRTHLHEAYLERRMHRPWRKRGS